MVLPVSYMLFIWKMPVYSILVCTILAAISVWVFQILYLSKITEFNIKHYFQTTIRKCLLVTTLSMPLFVFILISDGSFCWFVASCMLSLIWILFVIYKYGCTDNERLLLVNLVSKYSKNII